MVERHALIRYQRRQFHSERTITMSTWESFISSLFFTEYQGARDTSARHPNSFLLTLLLEHPPRQAASRHTGGTRAQSTWDNPGPAA